jgi:hypothetical protein
MKKILVAICLCSLVCGCYSRVSLTTHNTSKYTPRTNLTQIEILTEIPSTPYVDLGYLQGNFESIIRIPPKNIYKLKEEAANAGADAIINLSCIPDGIGWGATYCQGIAIRFMTQKALPKQSENEEKVTDEECNSNFIKCFIRAYERFI